MPALWVSGILAFVIGLVLIPAIQLGHARLIWTLVWLLVVMIGLFCVTGFVSQTKQAVANPILWAGAALTYASFWGPQIALALAASIWPLLGAASVGVPRATGIAASLCAAAATIVLAPLFPAASLPPQAGWLAFVPLGLFILTTTSLVLAVVSRVSTVIGRARHSARALVSDAQASRDLAQAEARAARAETEDRSRFMAEMSHEIRTPLNAILGFADTMREQIFGPLPQPYQDYPGLIHTSGSHLLDLVSDLLDISKIEAGRYEVRVEPVRLDQFLFEAMSLSQGAAQVSGVQLRHEAGHAVTVQADYRALRQIAFNLVSNAIKFTPKGGSVTLRIRLDQTHSEAVLEVEDTGSGISPADLARIGQPWAQADNQGEANARVTRSSGLGLAVVKRLAELQGGRFWLESRLNVGTLAKLALPLSTQASSETGAVL